MDGITRAQTAVGSQAQPSAPTLQTGGQILVECLKIQGVELIFGVPGESYLAVLDALYDEPGIRFICGRHEGAAANMAEADGKLTNRPGICLVTRGPGATHACVGVHTASQDSTPMILLIGQVPRGHRGREAFQEIDYEKMFGSMAKWVAEVSSPERIPEYVSRAFSVSLSARPGPVVLSLPEDVLAARCRPDALPAAIGRCEGTQSACTSGAIQALQAELCNAKQPLVLLGGSGWAQEDCAAFEQFAQHWDLPVIASFRRQDLFDNSHANYVGQAGPGLNPKLAARIRSADLIVAAGCRLSDIATAGYSLLSAPRPRQRLVHVHADPQELGRVYAADVAVCACMPKLASALGALKAPSSLPWKRWRAEARQEFLEFTRPSGGAARPGVDLAQVVTHLAKVLAPDAIVTNGAGNYTVWVHRFYTYRRAKTQLAPISGAMGYGLPAAITAKLRYPDRQVVCFAGDGCFLMYPQELSTALQVGAAVIVLVVNNGLYGTIRMHQERTYPGRAIGTAIVDTDFAALAQALGAYAERVHQTDEFPAAFERAVAARRPALLELRVDPGQITPDSRVAAARTPAPGG